MSDSNVVERLTALDAPGPDWLERTQIREARRTDLSAMEWEGEYTRFRHVYGLVYERSVEGKAVLWVADLAGVGLLGQVFVQLVTSDRYELADGKTRAYVHSFRVRPAYRGAGLGTRLMNQVEEDLARRGFSLVCLNVGQENEGARRLYERLGYHVADTDAGEWSYYDEKGILREVKEPGWKMEKRLA